MPPDEHLTGRLAPNSMLQGRYIVRGLAGQGGMGAVYEALDTGRRPNRRVAIKEMGQSKLRTKEEVERARKRFRGEADMLRSLDHPNLPRVYDSFEEGGRSYLVMEYVEGQSLLKRLEEVYPHPLPTNEVLGYAAQLCDVLDYLHRQYPPIIFRDLKPANIMIKPNGQIMLVDFGIARFFKPGQLHDTEGFMSYAYASPQQRDGKQTNVRSDLYSLGATLHHCLTGKVPSYASNHNIYPPIRDSNPRIPPRLDQAILKLVEVDEERRPKSADAFLQEMIAALKEEKQAAQVGVLQIPPTQRASRNPSSLHLPFDASNPDSQTYPPLRRPGDSEPVAGWITDLSNGSKRLAASFAKLFPSLLALLLVLGNVVITIFTRPQDILKSFAEVGAWFEGVGQAIRAWSSRVLTPWFIVSLLVRLALLVVGSVYLFRLSGGSYTIVAFCLSLVALFITATNSISSRIREPVARSLLFCTAMALLLVCFALQATPDVQAELHRITFSQLLMVALVLSGLVTLIRSSNRLTWVDYMTLLGIASICALLQYTLGVWELRQISATVTSDTSQQWLTGSTAALAFIAFIALCRLGSTFAWIDRFMVLLVALLYAALQFTVGYQELQHLPFFAPTVSISRTSALDVAYIYLSLVFVPLGAAVVALFIGHRFAYISRIAIFLLAVACAILQDTLAYNVIITLPGSYTAVQPLALVIAKSMTFNQLFTYGGLIFAALLLLVRFVRPSITWINRPAVLIAATVGTLLLSAFWTDEVFQVQFPTSMNEMSALDPVTLIAANQLVADILLICVAIAIGLTLSIDLTRLMRQISWVDDSVSKMEPNFKWVNGVIKVVDRLLIIGLPLAATSLMWFYGSSSSLLALPVNQDVGLPDQLITLNQVVAGVFALFTLIELFRIGGKFNRWDCFTVLLAVVAFAMLAWGSASVQHVTPPVFSNVQQLLTNLSQRPSSTILLVFGLAFAGTFSLFWLQRASSRVDHVLRFVLLLLFGFAILGVLLQFIWPVWLVVALILLVMGFFVAVQMERVR